MLNVNQNSKATKMREIAKVREYVQNFTMSLDTLTEVKHVFVSKESISVSSIEIRANDNKKDNKRKDVSIDVIQMDKSCFNEDLIVDVSPKYVLVDGIKKEFELYTDCYAQFIIDPSLVNEIKTIFYSAETGQVFKRSSNRFGGVYVNLKTNHSVDKLPVDTVEYDPRLGVVTAGTLKKSCFYCHKVMKKSYIDFLNEKVNGAFETLRNKIFDNAGQVMKFLTRPGIAITGQNPIFELDSFAVVEDLSGYKKLDKLNQHLKGKGLKKMDGVVPFKAEVFKDNFRLETIAQALGLHIQFRTNKEIVSKVQGIPSLFISETLENQPLDKDGKVTYKIFTKDGQPTDLENVQAVFDMNGIKALGLNLDTSNSVNDIFYKFDRVTVNVMSIAKLTKGKMSKQAFEPIAVAASEKGQEMMAKSENFILDNFEKMMSRAADTLTKSVPTAPPLSCNYIMEVIKSSVPFAPLGLRTTKEQCMNMFAKVTDKLGVEITDDNGRNCMFNVVVCPDISLAISSKGIIPDGCVVVGKFSKDLALIENKYGRDSVEYKEYEAYCGTVIGFKYPKMHFREYLDAKIMNVNDIIEIINSRDDFSDSIKRKLIFHFTNVCDAIIMLPDDLNLMKKCAGLDFDWDKMTILLTSNYTFINDLLFGKSLLVNIKTDTVKEIKAKTTPVDGRGKIFESNRKNKNKGQSVPTDKDVVLDVNNNDFFWSAFRYAVKNLGNIGEITNWNNTIIGILVELNRGNSLPAKKFLHQLFGKNSGGKKETYSVDSSVVDIIFVDNILEEMRNCKWTKTNISNFLNDCCKVFRLYQEGTIDSSKTGIYLAMILQCLVVKAKSLLSISAIRIEDEDGIEVTAIKRASYKERTIQVERFENGKPVTEELETHLMKDFISEVQDKMINLVETSFESFFEEIKDDFTWKEDEIEYIGDVFDHACIKYPSVVSKLRVLNGAYISSLIEMINAKNKVLLSGKYEDKQLDKKLAGIDETFNLKIRVLSSTANRVMNNVNEDAEYKGALAMSISMLRNGGINPKSSNRFGIAMFPKEVYSFILGEYSSTIVCESKILQYGNEKVTVGDSIEVIRGISERGLILNDKFTGIVNISDNDIAFVNKPLEELGVVGGYDENSYSIVLRANDVDKNIEEDTFMGSITKDSAIHVTKKDVYFSKDLDSEFESIAINKNTNVLTDVELKTDYLVKSVYQVELYLGDRDEETNETVKTRCYIVELQK